MANPRARELSPIDIVIRNGHLLIPLAGWLALWIALYGVAGYRYAKVAVDRQPDLLKSVVRLIATSAADVSRDSFAVEIQATTPLPPGGAEVRLKAERGGAWVTLPVVPVRLSNEQPSQTVTIGVPQRPTREPATVALTARPLTPETVLVLPPEPLAVTITPRPQMSIPASIRLSAPAEVAADRGQFEVGIALRDGRPGETVVVTVQIVPPAEAGAVEPARHEVRLSDVDPRTTVRFALTAPPSTAQRISLEAKSADGRLNDVVSLTLLSHTSPSSEPLLVVKVSSPDHVPPAERTILQTVSWNGLRTSAPRSLRVTHNGPAWVTPPFQDVELRESSATKSLEWKVVSRPLAAEQTILFQAASDRVAAVAPWPVTLQPLLTPEARPVPLLVVIDTVLLKDEAAWFTPLLRKVIMSRRRHFRSEAAIILRKDGPPEGWTDETTFGAAGAHTGGTANDAMRQLADLLKQDSAASGPVVVLWANAFAPSAKAAIPYPVSRQRMLTLVWMNVKNVEEQGLFAEWNEGDTAETFQIELLAAPKNVLETSLDRLLSAPAP